MKTLNWSPVHSWRLAQHSLTPRLNSQDFVQVVTRTGGIQAQVMSAAELALCTRVEGLSAQDVRNALWQEHTLVRTWAMRGTLHVLSASELPLYVAARNWQLDASWSKYFAEFGFSTAQQDAYLLAIPHVLEQGAMTRPQLADAVAKHIGVPSARDFILSSSWGAPLKPSAYRGELSFGPGQGQSVTFLNPKAWIGEWQLIEPEQALQEMARRYLRAYGPANADNFAFWWGCGKTQARKIFKSLEEELEEVEVEGWRAFALRETLPLIQSIEPTEQIHLLPLFDTYTIGSPRDCEPLLAHVHKRKVFNLQGWTFAVVLVNGSIQGLWQSTTQRSQTVIKVQPFSSFTPEICKGIEAEAERLSDYYKTKVLLEYENSPAIIV